VDLDDLARRETNRTQPFIVVKGDLSSFTLTEFFVMVERRIVICQSLLQAVDICYKCHHILYVEFSPVCESAWKFIGHMIFEAKSQKKFPASLQQIITHVLSN
jgi:hypothetical protein